MAAVRYVPLIVAVGCIALLLGAFLCDVIREAGRRGGGWKRILVRTVVWMAVFAALMAVNVIANRNWVPGRCLFTIAP